MLRVKTLIMGGQPFLLPEHSDAGFTRRELFEAVNAGVLRRILDRVYVDALAPDTRALRHAAMRRVAPPQAIVADEWAAWLYGLDAFTPKQRHQLIPTLLVPHGQSRSRVEGIRCRQAKLSSQDITAVDGVLVTTPVRTASDFLRKRWRPYALAAADSMAHAGLVTADEVWEYVARLKGYPGIRQARSLALCIEPLAQSPGESWTRLRLLDAGFPRPQAQWPVVDIAGVQRYTDLAYVEQMVVIEYNGQRYHSSDDDQAGDEERRSLLEPLGLQFVVAQKKDIFGESMAFEQEVGALLGIEPIQRWW